MSDSPHLLRSPWKVVAVLALGASLLAAVIALAFTWTSVNTEPRNIPVGVIATDEQYTALEARIEDDVFDLRVVDDRKSATRQTEQRELYGAIILSSEPEIVIASAASPAVSASLADLARTIESLQPDAGAVEVTELAPLA